ncbi:MAG: hypothetical protein ABFD04_05915 [Syntrophomonas sp.]
MISTLPINPVMNIGGEPTLSLDVFLLMPGLSKDLPDKHRHQLLLDTGCSAIYLALVNILQSRGLFVYFTCVWPQIRGTINLGKGGDFRLAAGKLSCSPEKRSEV